MTSPDELSEVRLAPTAFRRSHVVTDAQAELASLIFVLDMQEQMPAVGRLRDWVLERLAPGQGETAVDVGCGTGREVRRFAALVGADGRAIGVEPHAGLRAVAEERAAGSTAEFIDGDALALPFDDGSVDVLRCERVWQHLDEPEQAAREVARVLAPTGRAVVVDSDWGTSLNRTADPDVLRRYNESAWGRMANPFAGRHLRGQLTAAGLTVDPDIGSTALVLPDEMTRNPTLLRVNGALAVEEGAISQEEADGLEAGVVAGTSQGQAFISVTMFAALAWHEL